MGLLPPISDAKRLMLSNFDTTLSFLVKECSPFRRTGSTVFFGLIRINEFTCPCLPDLTAFVLPDFLDKTAPPVDFATPGCVLFECGLVFGSFLDG